MSNLGNYLLSVCIAGIICGVLRYLLPEKGTTATIGRMLCGIFLLFSVLQPIRNFSASNTEAFWTQYQVDAEAIAAAGQQAGKTALHDSISQQLQSYILDKAEQYGAQLEVTVYLSDASLPEPVAVRLSGNIAPYAKAQLQTVIVKDLGIPKEAQQWI